MGLCGFGKKKETPQGVDTGMARMKVLGSGCSACNQLEASTKEALAQLGMDTAVDHVTDWGKIAEYGVMSTPALVLDGKVIVYGKVLTTQEVVALLKEVGDHD